MLDFNAEAASGYPVILLGFIGLLALIDRLQPPQSPHVAIAIDCTQPGLPFAIRLSPFPERTFGYTAVGGWGLQNRGQAKNALFHPIQPDAVRSRAESPRKSAEIAREQTEFARFHYEIERSPIFVSNLSAR